MKRKISTDDIFDHAFNGKIGELSDLEEELVDATKNASDDNKIKIGSYVVSKPFPDLGDSSLVGILVSMMFDRVEKIEEDLESIKKLLESKESEVK